jgi:L-lysine 6-transaminase
MTTMKEITPANAHETLSKYMLADGFELIYDYKKGKGAYLHDSRTGKDYLDLFSFFASMPVGHNHPRMLDAEFKAKMGELAVINPSNSDIYTVEFAEFVQTFGEIATPKFKHNFFVAGGALGIENAIKAACDWKVRKAGLAKPSSGGSVNDVSDMAVIHFKEAFHGRSGYTLSLTNTSDPRKYLYFPKFEWPRITNPKLSFPLNDANIKKAQQLESKALDEIQAAIKKHGAKLAALIIETIQGEGGDNHFRAEFFQALRQLCDKHDIMLILDEVQSGIGITGKMWGYEHFGFQPDMICFGKKTQVCGFAATARIDEVKDNVFKVSSRINSTWGGNLIDMMRCKRYLEIISDEHLVDNARHMGEYALGVLNGIEAKHPAVISNTRGRGLMMAFDLPSTDKRDKFLGELEKNRLILLGCGEKSIRFRPHLDISRENIQRGMEIIEEVARNFAA